MISLVLYGRNDNYGYNLHKRAAISFNAMAELLTDPDDEILFVDYNTPDDMPSFVEAILDTLTDQARRVIRVLRVRPSYHQRWREKTHLNALESVSRNIAIRRSNPNNKWILSTNTDMVFVMRDKHRSLADAVRDLPRGYYGIPRFEMPESLWESLDRKEPRQIIASFAAWGKTLHLDEVVHSHKSIIYDGPGDFQLIPRDDMFKIHGFSEAMLRGWHVDSNFAKRCLLLYGETRSLFHRVSGYHCDHTKVVSPLHGHDRTQNDMVEHITNVTAPQIPAQAADWGAPNEKIEELRFPPGCSVGFAGAIAPLLGPMPVPHYEATYTEKTWNQFTYHARHALPYLADHLVTLPRDIDIGYAGLNDTLRALLAEAWRALGFTGRLLVLGQTAGDKPGCAPAPDTDAPYAVADIDYIEAHAQLFILDLGTEEGPHWTNRIMNPDRNPQAKALMPYVKAIQTAGLTLASRERRRLAQRLTPRRFIFVNTIGGELLGQIDFVVGQTATPYCTHARHGTVKPDPVDTLAQRRADADRLAASIADEVVATARQFLPIQFLDRIEPAMLLSAAQRAEIAAEIPKRDRTHPWTPVAALMLGRFEPDFAQRIEAFLTLSPAEPQVFLQRLNMFRTAALEGMSRPWPPALAAVLDSCAGRFLEASRALSEDVQLRGYAGFLALCHGAAGESLGDLAGRLCAHAEARAAGLAAGSSAFDAWLALDMADIISRRPGTDAARVQQGLTAPALAHIAEARFPDPNRHKMVLIAAAPYGSAVDPAAGLAADAIAGLLARGVSPDALLMVPLASPDQAFLAAMRRAGVAVAPEFEAPAPGFVGLMARALKTVQAIRDANPAAALAIGGDALSLAILAKGVAPAQATIFNRLAFAGAPGIDAVLAPDALGPWLDRIAGSQLTGSGSVHAAAE